MQWTQPQVGPRLHHYMATSYRAHSDVQDCCSAIMELSSILLHTALDLLLLARIIDWQSACALHQHLQQLLIVAKHLQ